MSVNKTAFILCAGLGTRMKPFTDMSIKPLAPLLGVEFLYHQVNFLAKNNISSIILNSHYKNDFLEEYIAEVLKVHFSKINFIISFEEKLLGSGGGLLKVIHENFELCQKNGIIVMNSDSVFIDDFSLNMLDFSENFLMASTEKELIDQYYPKLLRMNKSDSLLSGVGAQSLGDDEKLAHFTSLYYLHGRTCHKLKNTFEVKEANLFQNILSEIKIKVADYSSIKKISADSLSEILNLQDVYFDNENFRKCFQKRYSNFSQNNESFVGDDKWSKVKWNRQTTRMEYKSKNTYFEFSKDLNSQVLCKQGKLI